MNENKTTKRALGSSIVALLVCFTMLLGSTYAWFTDVVTSSGNVIKTGTLDVAFTWTDDADAAEDTWNDVEAENAKPIFDAKVKDENGNEKDVLWEPGYTAVRYLKVENKGTLALKYKLQIVVNGEIADENDVKLSDVIDVYYAPSKVDVRDRDLDNNPNLTKLGTLTQFLTGAAVEDILYGKDDDQYEPDYATLVLKMQESAGNEYQNLSIGTAFDVMLFATQYTYEEDSFGPDYDAGAKFPAFGTGSANANDPNDREPTAAGHRIIVTVMDDANEAYTGEKAKLATAYVYPESVEALDKNIEFSVTETDTLSGNFTLVDGQSTKNYEITATNIKPDNTEAIEVTLRIGTGLNFVGLYHKDALIPATYDAVEGNLVFKTTSFSPFSVVLSDKPAEVIPGLPQAEIVNVTNEQPEEGYYYNPDFVGKSFTGGITLVNPGKIDSVYRFTALDTLEEAQANKYADWKCDFFVKVDKDIAANSIILAGYYEKYLDSWIAFDNPVEIEGDTYIPLLLLVSNGWTYEDIVEGVGTFYCGVKDADGSLAANDVTFTVQLRLVNPEAEDLQNPAEGEYIVIEEVSYNFKTGTSSK